MHAKRIVLAFAVAAWIGGPAAAQAGAFVVLRHVSTAEFDDGRPRLHRHHHRRFVRSRIAEDQDGLEYAVDVRDRVSVQ
jgi:hypothetical protein